MTCTFINGNSSNFWDKVQSAVLDSCRAGKPESSHCLESGNVCVGILQILAFFFNGLSTSLSWPRSVEHESTKIFVGSV